MAMRARATRVSGFIVALTLRTRPENVRPGAASVVIRAGTPGRTRGRSCSNTSPSTTTTGRVQQGEQRLVRPDGFADGRLALGDDAVDGGGQRDRVAAAGRGAKGGEACAGGLHGSPGGGKIRLRLPHFETGGVQRSLRRYDLAARKHAGAGQALLAGDRLPGDPDPGFGRAHARLLLPHERLGLRDARPVLRHLQLLRFHSAATGCPPSKSSWIR
jgi:hypothetical protein